MALTLLCNGFNMASRSTICALILLTASCGSDDQTGVPQPIGVPKPALLRASGADGKAAMEIEVLGLPGAVSGAGRVEVISKSGSFGGQSAASGSFALVAKATAGESIEIRYEGSDPTLLFVSPTPKTPTPQVGTPENVTPKSAGFFTLQLDVTLANTDFVVANFDNGATLEGQSDDKGMLEARIAAKSGDAIKVYMDRGTLVELIAITAP